MFIVCISAFEIHFHAVQCCFDFCLGLEAALCYVFLFSGFALVVVFLLVLKKRMFFFGFKEEPY